MWTGSAVHLLFFFLVILCSGNTIHLVTANKVPRVTSIDPKVGSLNGGTRLTLNGENFAETLFTLGDDPDIGNKVTLTSLTGFTCDIHPDGTHKTQVVCYTTPMPEGDYDIKLSVNGVDVPDENICSTCTFTVKSANTPTISSIIPPSGLPGQIITIEGYLTTNKYGSNLPDETQANILRVFFGGQKCELHKTVDGNLVDDMYGLVYSDEEDEGYMKCKTEGTFVGNQYISYLVSKEYGRSLEDGYTKYPRSNGISMYQTFAEITNVSLSHGSTEGGTKLTITGMHFDETKTDANVEIAGAKCVIADNGVSDTEIVCETPADSSEGMEHFTGNRGFLAYVYSGVMDAASINKLATPAEHLDSSEWKGYNLSDHTVLMDGYFVPAKAGNYSFCLKAASRAKAFLSTDGDPASKVLVADGTNTCGGSLTAYSLEEGQRCFIEVQYQSNKLDSYVTLKSFVKETSYSETDTKWAVHERQKVEINSRTDPEIQKLVVTSSGNVTLTPDVQELSIAGDEGSIFVLGLDGIYTTSLVLQSLTTENVLKQLKKLPSIVGEVEVDVQGSDTNKTVTITSSFEHGIVGDYDVKLIDGLPSFSFTNTRTTQGSASSDYFTLSMNDTSTAPLQFGSSANQVENELERLFSVQCHPELKEGTLEDFESKSSWMSEIASDTEPFCGRYSIKNPYYVFREVSTKKLRLSATSNRYICFAYKGPGALSRLLVKYENIEDGKSSTKYLNIYIKNENENLEEWNYWCEDIYTILRAKTPGESQIVIWIRAIRKEGHLNLFLDQMAFRKDLPISQDLFGMISIWRKPQVQPKGFFIDSVDVTKNSNTEYEITLKPHHCGHGLDLFEALHGTVTRVQSASIPIVGSYKLSFKNDPTDDIPVTVKTDPNGVAALLGATSMGFAEVDGEGTCSKFSYTIKMVSHTGDQPLIEVDTSDLTGDTVTSRVTVKDEGGLWLSPIMGDLLRTHHTKPQVIAYINGIPTRCALDSCDYLWSEDSTPVVSNINPQSGSNGDVVTITGSGFSDNTVMLGNTACNVTGSTSNSITCTVGNGPTGPATVYVKVQNKGLAKGNVTFTFAHGVDNFPAKTGSLEGGTLLAIDGFGFTSDAVVEVDGNICTIVNVTESQIECITPRSASLSTTAVSVTVSQEGTEVIAGTFTYDPADTPIISSINVTSSPVWGGDFIKISGTGFGNVEMPVILGGVAMDMESYSDTEIIAVLPALPHGAYKIRVNVDGKGYADLRTNSISDISYSFVVNYMYPDFGSVYGGTDMTIQGAGFHKPLLEVSIGPHECILKSVSDSQINCRIDETETAHHIFANGTHKNYGIGYAWDKDPSTVNVGDMVTWHWETPFYVRDIAYAVRQTAKPNDLEDMPGGFSSGDKSRKGTFSHTFTVPGTYYYWTNFMDSSFVIYFRGVVNVVPLESSSHTLSVKMLGKEASYQTSGSGTPPSSLCPDVTSNLTDCVDDKVLKQQADKFNFKLAKCYSPYINSQSPASGSFDDVISLQGDGFGNQVCQNEVTYGKDGCTDIVIASSSLDFNISPTCEPPIGELHKFKVHVHNLGYALMSLPPSSSTFGLTPIVEAITPETGSKVGGTKVTISGAGFTGGADNILVEFQRLSCPIESMNYTHIVCTTKCASAASSCFVGGMSFTVTAGNTPAKCNSTVCQFETREEDTPEVDSVTPDSVSDASTLMSFIGSKFSSDLMVMIGGVDCVVQGSVNETHFSCMVGRLPVGDNEVSVYVSPLGKAATTEVVTSLKIAMIDSPDESSIHGGATLVIKGNGFVDGDTQVTVNGDACAGKQVTLSQVTCTLPAQDEGVHNVVVISNGQTYSSMPLSYTSDSTPVVQSISPDTGGHTDTLVITGDGFFSPSGSMPEVKIGGVVCAVTSHTNTSITCTAGVQSTGQFLVQVFVEEKGYSNNDVTFTYELSAFTISPSRGSTNGGQAVTLTGSGFLENETEVTICGDACQEVSVTSSSYVCKTAAHAAGDCTVVAEVQGASQSNNAAYTYDDSLVSTVTDVSPSRGGTGGGTVITITGTNFGSTTADIQVEIEGSDCMVQTVDDTQIVCRTGLANKSAVAQVEVQRSGWGLAEQIDATYEYIDVWSSIYTWGGQSIPEKGDFIIIKKGQKILLDVNTPVLAMLLIQGGHLVFDEADIELQSQYILITDGGIFQVGSEDKRFEHKAIVTLHGHVRSKELPVYGAKGIGLREGTLDLYGRFIPMPWTYLSATAAAGATVIHLEHGVNWNVGDEIVIATTGDRLSQKESEVMKIQAVSGDGLQLTLEEPLVYEHISETATFGSRTVKLRAEVGLLTRNVVVRGYRNSEFDHNIEACPDGFKPGEFQTQTCFQGRFGEEVGSDQYGVHILIHQQDKDTQVAQAHLDNVEITHAGQAFRLGRYPVHFHLNGNMSQSFVRRCAIHHTFNRAVNIHGSHHTMVEHNVVYDAMGGALFLEDGDETGNTFQYNLEILIKSSTSLLNDDITPAGIWATNPYNYILHNAAAGGTHFGVWYRMHQHPDGPGATTKICPQNMPLGEYRNNTAHSLGWFGLWIFETYVPKDSHICSSSAPHKVAKFYTLTAWNNNEGAEAVNAGAIQFHDFIAINNQKSGIHFSLITGKPPQYDPENGPGVFNSVIVARHSPLRGLSTGEGIVQPHYNGFMMKDVEFHNFDQDRSTAFTWVTMAGVCVSQCGGFTTAVTGLTFVNSPRKVKFAWENEGVIHDLDGSLTGQVGASAVACSGSFDMSKCSQNNDMSYGVSGCVCNKDIKFIRFAFNNIKPESLLYKTAQFTSEHGTTNSKWIEKRISHKKGWQAVLMANTSYDFSFENAEQAVNISYDGQLYRFSDGDYVIMTQNAYQMPDIFQLDGSKKLPISTSIPSGDNVEHGQWYFNNSKITYALKNMDGDDLPVKMRITRCLFRGCKPPPSPMSVIKEPENAEYTSFSDTWNNITTHGGPAKPMDDLYIAYDRWIIVDTVLPKLGKVIIEGGLQFAENLTQANLLEADYIYVKGRLVAGWSDENPFHGKLTIRLRGDHSTPNYPVTDGANLGSKFIAVFGGLQLHGASRGVTKTFLASGANPNDGTITVKDAVNWKIGEDILISTTDYDAWHTEVFQITGVTGKTLSLNGTIKHRHISHTETVNSKTIELSASVALLTRNIRVEGAEYDDLITESFGARILVGQTVSNGEFFSGFAQVSNVEFFHAGQEGFTSSYDARYALTYMGVTSTEGKVRYSYARHNAFHNGFSPAIGVFGTDGLEIEDNTIHHTVGPGIQTESTGTVIKNNLVTLSIWPGAYLDRRETENYDFSGGIEARKSIALVLVDNRVAGSERAGYTLPGQACSTDTADLWSGNVAHSAQSGVALFMDDKPADSGCTAYSGFTLWKNFDYGIYYNNKPSVVIKNSIFIENSVGITPFVVGPSATAHMYDDKSVTIEDNIFIGKTSSFSDSLDVIPSGDNIAFSGQARGDYSKNACGKVGIMTGTFTSGSNDAPRKPWLAIMSYQAIYGITKVRGNHFANYGACTGGRDHAISTNKDNDDVIHPLEVSHSTLSNVEHTAKILFFEPNVGKINPSDCVDMDCDAHKKCLVTDLDGTFLGFRGNVLPEAAYEWDGNRQHGLGDYRIPTPMLSTVDGRKLDPDVIAPVKGLYKIDECVWMKEWNAYQCNNTLTWKMLVAESMDSDTEKRRISPVAVFNKEGYVDLVNGPQDHGWCSGYTCQKRLSTFPILVALETPFELFLTGTNPRKMRYMLLNSKATDCVQLSMWYNTINRLEVKVKGAVVTPNNGFYDNKGRYRIKLEETKGQYLPNATSKTVGENYISQEDQVITWVVCGGAEVAVTRLDALLVAFTLPEMTVDEFFGEALIENLAAFLNIDPKKVRVVNVVTNTSPNGRRRRRRESVTSTVYVEISDEPDAAPSVDITEVSDNIINMVQLGSVSEVLQVNVLYTAIVEPDSESDEPVVLQKPGQLVLDTPPEGLVAEDVALSVQPKLKVTDSNGDVVTHLGSATLVWEVEASIKSGGTARSALVGTTRMNFTNGWANFTDLSINDMGTDYIIEFNIVYPEQASNYSIDSNEIDIFGKQLSSKATLMTTRRVTDSPIELVIGLVDKDTGLDIIDIAWDDHTWEAEAEIYDTDVYSGTLSGDTAISFDPSTGKGTFTNLLLNKPGKCPLLVTIRSDPAGYLMKMVVTTDLITPSQDSMLVEESHSIDFMFPITFVEERAPYWADQVANTYSIYPGFKITGVTYRAGSLYVTLAIEASASGYNSTLNSMCEDIAGGRNFTFDGTTVVMGSYLTIDGKQYYGVSCGPVSKEDDDALDIIYIIIIAVLAGLCLILIAVVVYKCYVQPKAKTNVLTTTSVTPMSGHYYQDKDLLADVLLREETSSSFKSWTSTKPPMATSLPTQPPAHTQTPFDLRMKSPDMTSPQHRTPSPAWVK